MNYIINTDINVSGVNYRPNIVSISWGAPEIYWSSNLLDSMNSAFLALANIGVNITCAAGDNGSSDGTANDNCCDFPSSSPNVIAVGGTTLTCSNYVYDGSTSETVWSGTGGAKSNHFNKPNYQSDISGTKRSTPDLSLIADPNTGVLYKIGGSNYVIGGTSISSPFIAGYLAAINLNLFLNNLLYDLSSNCFHDITIGSNGLYNASVGYDNCSGFGTIIGTVMKNQLNISPIVPVQIVQISNPRVFVDIGKTYQYSISIFPANASNQNVTWSSSNPLVISVNNGLITGLSLGKATISVITQDGNFISSVIVNCGHPMNKISFSKSKYSTKVGRSISLSLTISPTNPSDKTISWSVSNNVGTISNGKVKGNRIGSAVVIARSTTYNLFAKTTVTFTKK
jgi:subtilase family serine protease